MIIAGVEAVEDDAGTSHAAGAGQAGGPVGVEHHPGGVVAVDDGRLKTGLGKALTGPDEELVRTQNTAKLYDQLGMAEYQAIEVFVKMF